VGAIAPVEALHALYIKRLLLFEPLVNNRSSDTEVITKTA
jgi:hypothetical protein